jgi:DNA-binding winged helix-turn-helix (wHTH) protein
MKRACEKRVIAVEFAWNFATRAAHAHKGGEMSDRQFVFAPFRLDLVNEQLWRGEEVVPLRPKLFAALRHLAEHAGRLVTREELLKAVWPTTVVSESVLRGIIWELRDVLDDDADTARFVETVPHRGYRFLPAVATAPPMQNVKGKRQNAPPSKPQVRIPHSAFRNPHSPWWAVTMNSRNSTAG